ncbi:hypothetical protein [Phytoactinopolyspora limicola]|uniref:hypothetical protein n=1 Tax=Phytoactinopolyspora limicola TaxID=2715536 RepID=UPI001A9C6DEC|nr:hypothetical protein [Phytoactinopolyspora limicola]
MDSSNTTAEHPEHVAGTNMGSRTFSLEVQLDALADEPGTELGRILRYWAGNLKHYNLQPGIEETVVDSAYSPVGSWRISG